MAEYIDREAFKEVLTRYLNAPHVQMGHSVWQGMRIAIKSCLELLDNEYAADVAPVRHGRWISVPHKLARVCSVCNRDEPHKFADIDAEVYDYCPNCGAKMDGGAE